jgi:hypothetical protein
MGKNDEFYTSNVVDEELKSVEQMQMTYEILYFEGRHEINEQMLQQLSEELCV